MVADTLRYHDSLNGQVGTSNEGKREKTNYFGLDPTTVGSDQHKKIYEVNDATCSSTTFLICDSSSGVMLPLAISSSPLGDLLDGDRVEETVHAGVDDGDLDLHRERLVLTLLEELSETSTTREQEAGRGVEVGAELRERRNLTVLGEVQLERTGELLHDLGLRGGAYARHGETDVDGRADTTEEELSLQEDLAVSDGDDLWRLIECSGPVRRSAKLTFVGMYADTSPPWVSMMGRAVSEPPPNFSLIFAARSRRRECR
jgi:hypothetical protein